VPIHGWILEPERDDPLHELMMATVREGLKASLELEPGEVEAERLERRLRWYLVDNESGEHVTVGFDGHRQRLGPSDDLGRFRGEVSLPAEAVRRLREEGRLTFEAETPDEPGRFVGSAVLVEPEGVSVISDVDDTIKRSYVTEFRRQLTNTLVEEYEAVPGMVELYERWSESGAAFHYVTASPWRLYPPLAAFMQRAGFPAGSFHMRRFRLQWGDGPALLADKMATKRRQIERLLERFPDRRFLLIGDRTEHDPVIYADLARDHPEQVARIYIREVIGEADEEVDRETFEGVPAERWRLFTEPAEIVGDAEAVFEKADR
jgi:hypothetical protein